MEHGIDEDGKPHVWPYVQKRDYTNKKKEPWDAEFLKISDAKITQHGEVIFDNLAHTRKATAHEISQLWDIRQGAERFEMAVEDVQRPSSRRRAPSAPSPGKGKAKASKSPDAAGTSAAVTSPGVTKYPVPDCPPGYRLLVAVRGPLFPLFVLDDDVGRPSRRTSGLSAAGTCCGRAGLSASGPPRCGSRRGMPSRRA